MLKVLPWAVGESEFSVDDADDGEMYKGTIYVGVKHFLQMNVNENIDGDVYAINDGPDDSELSDGIDGCSLYADTTFGFMDAAAVCGFIAFLFGLDRELRSIKKSGEHSHSHAHAYVYSTLFFSVLAFSLNIAAFIIFYTTCYASSDSDLSEDDDIDDATQFSHSGWKGYSMRIGTGLNMCLMSFACFFCSTMLQVFHHQFNFRRHCNRYIFPCFDDFCSVRGRRDKDENDDDQGQEEADIYTVLFDKCKCYRIACGWCVKDGASCKCCELTWYQHLCAGVFCCEKVDVEENPFEDEDVEKASLKCPGLSFGDSL